MDYYLQISVHHIFDVMCLALHVALDKLHK